MQTDLEDAISAPAKRLVVVLGAGPAGLTAACMLLKRGVPAIVLEQNSLVGGLARTEKFRGNSFDLGGHRFYTKSREVQQFWHDTLGPELLLRHRLSRIYYRRKFFLYPLRPWNALCGLGLLESFLILLSYVRWRLFPHRQEETYEQWVTNRFGRRLFQTFFKAYTEKVWGVSCSELRAEWAAQRIKGLSFATALRSMFWKSRQEIRTLVEQFHYPRLGPGMMWNAVKARIEHLGGEVRLESTVMAVQRAGNRIQNVVISQNGKQQLVAGTDFVSSIPISELIQKLDPRPPEHVLAAARELKYRDFLTVGLIVNRSSVFPDNWIYVHEPNVKVGRIQNFNNWSPDMVADPTKTSLGLEYFCNRGDALWNMEDGQLIELAKRELSQIGLIQAEDVEAGCVYRVPNAYPVYDSCYREHLTTVRQYLAEFENIQTIGRNGLHRYNNQDHAMLTGMLAVSNLLDNARYDLWSVNADQSYLEEVNAIDESELKERPTSTASAVAGVDPSMVRRQQLRT
jgi:protoporphyrinogen oxidase